MAMVGHGNNWPKKDWYVKCSNCGKKGVKQKHLMTTNCKEIWSWKECRFCHIITNREVKKI